MQQPYVDQRPPHVRAGRFHHPIIPLVIEYLNEEKYRTTIRQIQRSELWPDNQAHAYTAQRINGKRVFRWSQKNTLEAPFELHEAVFDDEANLVQLFIGGVFAYQGPRFVAYLRSKENWQIVGVTFKKWLDAHERARLEKNAEQALLRIKQQEQMQKLMEKTMLEGRNVGKSTPLGQEISSIIEGENNEVAAETGEVDRTEAQ